MRGDGDNVLVVVINSPVDLRRVRDEGWYRIPLNRAPNRVGADYLAFYLTGAFGPDERWSVRYYAPVRAFRIMRRCDILPDEAEHPRAYEMYYQVLLGPLESLAQPVPSRRLRRIAFIPTTLERLLDAEEINDLWIKSSAQERLWAAMKDEDIAAERQYAVQEDAPEFVVDFALVGGRPNVAVIVVDEPGDGASLSERMPPDYLLARSGWLVERVTCAELEQNAAGWLRALIERTGGQQKAPG